MNKSSLKLILSMIIFGTVGLFVRNIAFGSATIAAFRGFAGCLFLLVIMLVSRKRPSFADIRRNIVPLLVSGALIGFNWIFLFEAYNYTSVSAATLCYYMAPAVVIVLSPLVLKEKFTAKKAVCLAAAVTGMTFVSGIVPGGFSSDGGYRGILFGLAAALLYGCVILCNKKIRAIGAYDKTTVQLFTAAVVVLPYALVHDGLPDFGSADVKTLVCLAVVALVHTGIAYSLYFGSMDGLDAGKIAIMSYTDPVVAVICSAVLLREKLTVYTVIGGILIIAAALLSETDIKLPARGKKNAG